jgi:chorismate-pyruvate lyase
MTRLRKLATKISCLVVRATSPVAKDWAKASSREIEFVESDWAALRWALGSTKVLFRICEEVPLQSLSGVPLATQRLAKQTAVRARQICIVTVFEVLVFARSLWHIHNPVRRTGIYLVIAALAYCAVQVLARRGRRVPQQADLSAQIVHYRDELERERRFHSGVWLWSRMVLLFGALAVFMVAGAIAPPTSVRRAAIYALILAIMAVFATVVNSRMAAKFQRRIEELDTLKNGEA